MQDTDLESPLPSMLDTKDACDLLDADHIAVKHLFVEYARMAYAAPEASAPQRQQLAARICRELTLHASLEEEIFYPALREAVPDAAPLLDEARQEHQQAKELVARIEAMRNPGPEMDELVAQLACMVEHHVKEERDGLFTKARSAPSLDLDELGQRLQAQQQELQASTPAR